MEDRSQRTALDAPSTGPALRCPICGSTETRATRHPSKHEAQILDCAACGGTSVVTSAAPA